jgi:hypothetical protein
MMKHLSALLLVTSALLFTGGINAQNSKCEPNQCTTKSSGKYKVELAGCSNYLDIYVLDQSGEPLRNTVITGSVEFFYLDETSLITNFKQFFRTNSLRAHVPAQGFYNCKVKLIIEHEIVEMYFDNECNLRG